MLTGGLVLCGLCTGRAAADGTNLPSFSLGPSSMPRYREKNSSSHPKKASLSSALRCAQSIWVTVSGDDSRWLGGYPLVTRVGGGRTVYTGGAGASSLGREAREATGGAVPAPDPTSGRDLDGGGGGGGAPLVDVRDEDVGGARFQLGSQLVLDVGMLERRSRVFVTLVMPTSLAFSALAFSSATGGRDDNEELDSAGVRLLTGYHRLARPRELQDTDVWKLM